MSTDKVLRGNCGQFFVAAELCRRNCNAVVTLGNCPNTDILCSNLCATKFAHIQVKTFVPGSRGCSVGEKAERFYGPDFFWILAGIPDPSSTTPFEYYVIPCQDMARNIKDSHELWKAAPGKNGQAHSTESTFRKVLLPPRTCRNGWDISGYLNRWDLIVKRLS